MTSAPFTTRFPDDFLFGAATASFQIEGATSEGGRLPSIWDTFCDIEGKVANKDTGDPACDHYRRMPQDVEMMTELGLDAYRFSVAWPRVIPTGTGKVNPEGIDFYDRLVDRLLDNGIRPWVTLYHWDLPQALDDLGGWLSRDIAGWFGDYTEAVVGALGDRVANWTTLNEPWCSSILSYSLGHHAPGHQDPIEGMIAAHHLMLAHGTAVPIIRDVAASKGTQAEVSITLNPSQVLGPPDPTAADLDAVRRADNVFNGLFFSPLFHGEYPNTMLEDIAHLAEPTWIHDGDLRTISVPLDNLGINNYFPTRVKATDPATNPTRQPGCEGMSADAPQGKLTDMGWEISPDAHRDILLRSWEESGLPIYVTENGSAWPDVVSEDGEVHDPDRTAYLHGHLAAVREAIDAGADIRGYFAWSLMDNFEWAFGYDKRFGIVHVDYDTQKRTIKDSGKEYARIIAEHHGTGSA
jgi:beta-glucosidase